jgi:hypothetical protein
MIIVSPPASYDRRSLYKDAKISDAELGHRVTEMSLLHGKKSERYICRCTSLSELFNIRPAQAL